MTPRTKEGYDIIKKRTLLVLEALAAGTDNNDKIGEIDRAQFEKYRPSQYIGPESVEVQVDKQYETTCLVVSQKTTLRAKDMTVLEYYNALATIEKQIEAETKAAKPRHK